uniref:FecR family protein n=1 Tax=Phocaeicola sp. TaxID=2773926 RepID=UPI003FEEB2B9
RVGRLWGLASLAGAAAACLVLAVLFVGRGMDGREDAGGRTAALAPIEIQPGRAVATLTLADGRQFELEEMTGADVRALTDSLHRTAAAGDAPSAYNTLDIPAGGEYAYVLPDGTKVRLNSMTRLRYPVHFTGSERRVELQGEAYFEVAHDARKPFIVRTGRGDITVYGTRFNVTDYADSPFAAVLVSGSIGFRPAQGGQTVRLRPSELLTCDADGHTTVTTVDPSVYTAWVDHRFVFRGQTLESIMTTLARWYDFTPVFRSDEARRIRLSGRLNRHEDIRVLLRSYEATTGLTFRIEGRNIVITP